MGDLKQDLSHDQPCKPRADLANNHPYQCAIQDCLNRNSFNEERCQAQIDALYECCNAFYQSQGDQASTLSCPKANLLRLKMKQRAQTTQQ